MKFLQLITHYPTITDKILNNLSTEDKRRLFFSSIALQTQLKRYKQLKEIATTGEREYMFFYFPKLNLNPCCLTYPLCKRMYTPKRYVVRLEVNSNPLKIKCGQCSIYFLNPQGETEFPNCITHKHYYYSRGQMIIKMKNTDPTGRPWTDRAIYKPSPQKALCYCKVCKNFLFYNDIHIGYKEITCIQCLKGEFKSDREDNRITVTHAWLGTDRAFCVPNATFRALWLY